MTKAHDATYGESYPYNVIDGDIRDAKNRRITVAGNRGIAQLLNEVHELRHDLERAMANHNADLNAQSLSDRIKDISLGLTTGRYDKNKVCGKLDSLAEELRLSALSETPFKTCDGCATPQICNLSAVCRTTPSTTRQSALEEAARKLEFAAHHCDRREAEGATIHAATTLRDVAGELRAMQTFAPSAIACSRNDVLEEAARVCEAGMNGTSKPYADACFQCAGLIREQKNRADGGK